MRTTSLALGLLVMMPVACGDDVSPATPTEVADAVVETGDRPIDPAPDGSLPTPTEDADVEPVETGTDALVETATEAAVDAPPPVDWSKVNPLEGSPKVEKVVGGFGFTEGTTWNAAGGFLLFSDIPNNKIHKLVPPNTVSVFRADSGKSNGLQFDGAGRLFTAEHWNRRLARTDVDGKIVVLADKFGGQLLNSPNDVIVRSDGNVYFTDPDYGLEGRPRGVDKRGVYRIDPKGELTRFDTAMNQPNGIALSPDESVLYVADSASPNVWKWNVAADGSVSGRTKFADSNSDGMAVDDAGNVYLTSGGVKVLKPGGGSWGTISVPEGPANCAFGGPDRKTLYIAARTSIYRVTLAVPGKP
jgi:gluconolactonase